MEKFEKKHRTVFAIALIVSVLFAAGIPAIFLGASNKIWAIMILGIVCVVGGFYGLPFLWISFASGFSMRRILELIERDRVYSVAELCGQTGMERKSVLPLLKKALAKRYIESYLLVQDEFLKLNENMKQAKRRVSVKCGNCGASVEISDVDAVCPYCGTVVGRD